MAYLSFALLLQIDSYHILYSASRYFFTFNFNDRTIS